MALPATLDKSTPAGSEVPSLGDDRIRELKLFIQDVFGVPDATAIAAAVMTVTAAGLTQLAFQNSGFAATLAPGTLTANRAITLPDLAGVLALVSQIPNIAGLEGKRVQFGTVTIAASGAGATQAQSVSFGTTFGGTPIVVIGSQDNSGSSNLNIGVWRAHTVGASSFTAVVTSNDGATALQAANYTAAYVAIGNA